MGAVQVQTSQSPTSPYPNFSVPEFAVAPMAAPSAARHLSESGCTSNVVIVYTTACGVTDMNASVTSTQLDLICNSSNPCSWAYDAIDASCGGGTTPSAGFCSQIASAGVCYSALSFYQTACAIADLDADWSTDTINLLCDTSSAWSTAYAALGVNPVCTGGTFTPASTICAYVPPVQAGPCMCPSEYPFCLTPTTGPFAGVDPICASVPSVAEVLMVGPDGTAEPNILPSLATAVRAAPAPPATWRRYHHRRLRRLRCRCLRRRCRRHLHPHWSSRSSQPSTPPLRASTLALSSSTALASRRRSPG